MSDECKGVIPDTFIACGEGGQYCSDPCRLVGSCHECGGTTHGRNTFAYGEQCGAAVAFGLMGMAFAIRNRLCWMCGGHGRPGTAVCKKGTEQ